MDVFTAIRERRSIGKVKSDPIPEEVIQKVIEAGIWAPTHFRTEPWKFVVFMDEGRMALGEMLAAIGIEGKQEISFHEKEEIAKKKIAMAFRAPVIIVVIVTPLDDPKIVRQEEIAAGNAAMQNMLLAVHALGLGGIWRTGPEATHPKMKEFFKLDKKDVIVGFLYMGYPDMSTPKVKRTPFEEKTTWIK